MDIYESESGFFDKNNNIEKGREIYYYPKGHYYMAIGKHDSAEFYFRKELREGRDFNNQNAGSRGLALLFQQTHRPDSAAKYALYSYAMNDSVYAHMATQEVERMKAMYDFTYHKNLAEQTATPTPRLPFAHLVSFRSRRQAPSVPSTTPPECGSTRPS